YGSSWGFAAIAELTDAAARRAGSRAAAIAKASATVAGPPMPLRDVPPADAEYRTPVLEDPFAVPLAEKCDLLVSVTTTMLEEAAVRLARANLAFWETEKWFASSQGHRVHQVIVESGGGMDATAVGEDETQRRSYPQAFGQYETGGYEVVRRFDLPAHTHRLATQAAALLSAPPCPAGTMDLVLGASQLALQIHESVGHAVELDRILGWEAAFAGTSFLDLAQLGRLRYGSDLMSITADATLPGALGTFGFDDEGTPAQRVDIVREGTWVGVLSGRDSAAVAGVEPGGMVRADGYGHLPMVRMTNVGLLPGPEDESLEAIVADTKQGVYLDTNRSWSIDDKRLNFQFGCEVAWEVRDGQLGRMLRNPTYTGITPVFWSALDRLAGPSEWVCWGVPNCGKGQPMQVAHTGHGASPGRFRDVRVGVSA
ncbi:MAG: TldD/PmbA family protein, partial [Acidimicrobiia bacterium]|nr:TldD/PmbA family protein [Acidimicrobiia bacterium]